VTDSLHPIYTLNTPILPVTAEARLVYLMIEVEQTSDAPAANGASASAPPVNLALVLDVSDSMHIRVATDEEFEALAQQGLLQETLIDGVAAWQSTDLSADLLSRMPRKIDRLRDALHVVIEHLHPDDRFSVVVFAGEALILIPTTSGAEKKRLLSVLDQLECFQLGDDTYIGRGMALAFETIRQGAANGLVNRMLILTDGFTRDEQDCRAWAARARKSRIPISTIGLGGDFNEELMIPIADQTGGEAYLLEHPEDMPAVFAQELQRAQAVHYRNLELKLRPMEGVELRAAYRIRPTIGVLETTNEGGSYSFSLGDMVTGEEPALLIELIVPPRTPSVYRLAHSVLTWSDPTSSLFTSNVRTVIPIEYSADPARVAAVVPPPKLMRVVEALSVYKLQRRAQEAFIGGDVEGATRKLRAAATRLLDMGEDALAAEVQQQAAELERRGEMDPERTKRLRYETRKLTQRPPSKK